MTVKKFLKSWMLPIAMVAGFLFYNYIGYIKFLTPYLLFLMLFITYTRIDIKEIRLTKFHFWLILFQLVSCWAAFYLLKGFDQDVACGVFLCFFICTATSAPVITGMLGGSIATLVSYSFFSNMVFALATPPFLSVISSNSDISFWESFSTICIEVLPLLILPLALAVFLRHKMPKVHKVISNHQSVSLYLWALAILIAVGNAVAFAMKQPKDDFYVIVYLCVGALVACCLQFFVGHKIGIRFGEPVCGTQGLGQKNTILAIWVAMTYLNPITSLAPASYIIWQNIINSAQIYRKVNKQ